MLWIFYFFFYFTYIQYYNIIIHQYKLIQINYKMQLKSNQDFYTKVSNIFLLEIGRFFFNRDLINQ